MTYTTYLLSSLVLLSVILQGVQSQAAPFGKTYLSQTGAVCNSDSYELGCGNADGTRVLNITSILMEMGGTEGDALGCVKSGICSLKSDEHHDGIFGALADLVKAITHNCQGKPKCEGIIPTYTQLVVDFNQIYDDTCGYDITEYLSAVSIFAECKDAGTVPTLAPYVFGSASSSPANDKDSTTQSTTRAISTAQPAAETTSKPTAKSTTKQTTLQASKSPIVSKKMADVHYVFIALAAAAGLAAVIGIAVTLYVLCCKTKTRVAKLNQAEHPLNDTEKGHVPLDDKAPPLYSELAVQ